MLSMKRSVHVSSALVVALALPLITLAEEGGRSSRSTSYKGESRQGATDPHRTLSFNIRIDPVAFLLNTVHGKYKLVRMDVSNRTKAPIRLSSEKDQFTAMMEKQPIPAYLNLQQQDSSFWDSLDKSMREALAYPQVIEAGGASPAERTLFILLPADHLTSMPSSFTYRIDSLGEEIAICIPLPKKD